MTSNPAHKHTIAAPYEDALHEESLSFPECPREGKRAGEANTNYALVQDNQSRNKALTPEPNTAQTGGGSGDTGENKIWAFMGAIGGAGVTSIAVQVAYDLAMRASEGRTHNSDSKVCLIDLDFEYGACPQYLDMMPSLRLSDLQENPDRIDDALTSVLVSRHESGLSLLGASCGLGGNDLVNPDTVLALLDTASQMFEYVILDVPRMWRPWTHATIAAADRFGLITEMNIPALHMARIRLEALSEQIDPDLNVDFIINKFERRSLRNALRAKDAEKALRRHVSHFIATDPDTTRDAINCGEAAGAIKPEARFVKDVRDMINIWAGLDVSTQSSQSQSALGGLLFNRRKAAR